MLKSHIHLSYAHIPSTIHRQLDFIYEDAGNEAGVPVGALTTENRDVWSRAREELLAFSQRNRVCISPSLSLVQKLALFFLTLLINQSQCRRTLRLSRRLHLPFVLTIASQ